MTFLGPFQLGLSDTFTRLSHKQELSIDLKEHIIDLNKSVKSLGAISKHLQVPRSVVRTTACKYKAHGTVVSLLLSGRKHKLNTIFFSITLNPQPEDWVLGAFGCCNRTMIPNNSFFVIMSFCYLFGRHIALKAVNVKLFSFFDHIWTNGHI